MDRVVTHPMGNKDTTISFRVAADAATKLTEIAEERDISMSAVMRDYVDMLVAHDGRVTVVPEHQVTEAADVDEQFPPTVEVPTSFVREHERLELEADHLRDQLNEYKRYVTAMREELDATDNEEVIRLEDLDSEIESEEDHFTIG